MHSLPTIPRFLQKLPSSSAYLRVIIFFGSYFICGFFMILGLMVTNNRGLTPIFAIPVALAAWMFRPRQAALAIGSIFLMLIIINTVTVKSLLWPFPLFVAFLCGIVAASIIACAISILRYALNKAEIASQQSREAEQQILNAYKQEQHLNEIKDQFLLNVNHELRTPLTSLHGYLQLLQEHPSLDATKQSMLVSDALESSEELVNMVNTILDAFRYDSAPLQPNYEDLALASVVKNAAELSDPSQWQTHQLDMQISETLKVKADYQLVHQVLWNLFSNACKYSPVGTVVRVSAEMEKKDSKQELVCIWVQDSGPGILPEEIPSLFRKFARLKRDQTGNVRGTGLGLYISKQLVEAMGGRICVESSGVDGEGSRFSFTLPGASHSETDLHPDPSF